MRGVNKVTLLGHLGKDPEIKYMPDGNAVASMSLATSEQWKDKQTGEKREATEWHRLVAYGKLAEIVGDYLHKGSPVYVEGKIKTRDYEKDGVKRYVTEIIVSELRLLGDRGGQQGQQQEAPQQQRPAPQRRQAPQRQPQQQSAGFDDDIPF